MFGRKRYTHVVVISRDGCAGRVIGFDHQPTQQERFMLISELGKDRPVKLQYLQIEDVK